MTIDEMRSEIIRRFSKWVNPRNVNEDFSKIFTIEAAQYIVDMYHQVYMSSDVSKPIFVILPKQGSIIFQQHTGMSGFIQVYKHFIEGAWVEVIDPPMSVYRQFERMFDLWNYDSSSPFYDYCAFNVIREYFDSNN